MTGYEKEALGTSVSMKGMRWEREGDGLCWNVSGQVLARTPWSGSLLCTNPGVPDENL